MNRPIAPTEVKWERLHPDYWLRWWDEQEDLLLWGTELAHRERDRAERLAQKLRSMGLEPEKS